MPPGLQKTIPSPTGPHGPMAIGACWSLQPDPLAPPAPAVLQFAAAPRFTAVRASRIWGFRPQPLCPCAWFILGTFSSLPSAKSVPCPSCSSPARRCLHSNTTVWPAVYLLVPNPRAEGAAQLMLMGFLLKGGAWFSGRKAMAAHGNDSNSTEAWPVWLSG